MAENKRAAGSAGLLLLFVSILAIVATSACVVLTLNRLGEGARLPSFLPPIGIAISLLAGAGAAVGARSVGGRPGTAAAPAPAEIPRERAEGVPFIDALTGIASRAWFDWTLNVEVERSRRYGHPLSVIVVLIDRYSELTASRGNAAGDYLLMTAAGILRSRVRQTDQAARLRGEEFAVIASETEEKGGLAAAEKLRRAVEIYPFDENIEVTISAGVAGLGPTDTASTLLQRAERALAAARAKGGNSVATAAS